jgi:hypothetical protein
MFLDSVYGAKVRMNDLRREFSIAHKALFGGRIVGEFVRQEFDGDPTIQPQIFTLVDLNLPVSEYSKDEIVRDYLAHE